ncbi:hypothetical protein CEXT_388111 [Caerostris extrusa]|uniref:Uncharacterized protein n=1 Tax=Caerostris extrusa TaxID=172846 RepID=A0AAV4R7Y4_CAEEX|nr:hypothetical protein CEXT_388111 [Caerostris extrusa]
MNIFPPLLCDGKPNISAADGVFLMCCLSPDEPESFRYESKLCADNCLIESSQCDHRIANNDRMKCNVRAQRKLGLWEPDTQCSNKGNVESP